MIVSNKMKMAAAAGVLAGAAALLAPAGVASAQCSGSTIGTSLQGIIGSEVSVLSCNVTSEARATFAQYGDLVDRNGITYAYLRPTTGFTSWNGVVQANAEQFARIGVSPTYVTGA